MVARWWENLTPRSIPMFEKIKKLVPKENNFYLGYSIAGSKEKIVGHSQIAKLEVDITKTGENRCRVWAPRGEMAKF